jgi:deazaflavin-dependent oxidoreductase (nitroreductase family)
MADEPGALTAPPRLTGVAKAISDASRTMFLYANRYAMVPIHRAGLGAWFGSPFAGWQCLLTTTGRRSGLPRPAPLAYIVMDGAAWALAGYGPNTHWYRNILDEPRVQLRLPGRGSIAAIAEDVPDPETRARVIPPLCRSMALPGAMIGCFPPIATDGRILECVSWVPLVRIAPADGSFLEPGPDDPGGRGWLWRQTVALGATLLLLAGAKRVFRG